MCAYYRLCPFFSFFNKAHFFLKLRRAYSYFTILPFHFGKVRSEKLMVFVNALILGIISELIF